MGSPTAAKQRASYLARMKSATGLLAADAPGVPAGRAFGGLASQYAFAFALPHRAQLSTQSSFHESRLSERT